MDTERISALRKFVAPEYIYGTGSRELVSRYAQNLELSKIMLVTDKGVKKAGWSDEVRQYLTDDGIETIIYDEVSPNPRDYEVMKGADIFLEQGCDSIVAVGGGSVMDCAKGIGIVVSNQKHILSFEGVDMIFIPPPPLICLPTTAGTSADVSQFCIITDTKKMVKIAIISKMTIPDVSLIDPEMTLTMPLTLTVETGLDALTHAIEAFVSNAHSPMTDLNSLEAIRLINKNLPKVFENPERMEYREPMMLGSLYAGLAFSNASLGAVHAMAHSLGGLKDLPHGLCNTILLDKVIDYNFDAASSRYRKIADVFNLKATKPSDQLVRDDLNKFIKDIKQQLGVDKKLSELGLLETDIPSLSAHAINDACIVTNPKKASLQDLKRIYEKAI
ncbi:MAG: iron-containing alcohol dehydrogenase [Gammaproteobacteria bacterium]|nr:iron-containing alcohol dehydrogenase [Gammaproteobacteria bacterium]